MTQGGAIRARQRVAPRLSPFRVSRRFQVTVFEFYESRVEKQISALEPKRRGLPITTSDCAVRQHEEGSIGRRDANDGLAGKKPPKGRMGSDRGTLATASCGAAARPAA